MTTETKLCVDCAHHVGDYILHAQHIYRDPSAGRHWCAASQPDIVDGGPTEACSEMRGRIPGSVTWPACGYAATMFVPRQNEHVPFAVMHRAIVGHTQRDPQ